MVEAETGRFIKFNTGFVGDTNLAQHNGDSTTNRAYLEVVSGDPDPTGYEPVFAKEGVGMTTCGGYGHRVGRTPAFAFVESAAGPENLRTRA